MSREDSLPTPISPVGAAEAEEPSPSSSIDLERREERFIIYMRDTPELLEAMQGFTRQLHFPNTPVTRTVYFGDSARGLPRGLSIKARTYERERLPGRWDLSPESMFQLLELKRTVDVEPRDRAERDAESGKKKRRDQMVEILRLSSSLFERTGLKEKKRKPRITLGELLQIIGDPPAVRDKIEAQLYVHLLETVHPLGGYRWIPLIGTEYERTHFVTSDPSQRDIFRATLDKRVTHYAFQAEAEGEDYVGVPVGTEDFSRFEIKADQERLSGTELGEWLEEILVRFRAFRIPSKKYRGLTLRSSYQIRREGLRNEVPGHRIYARFPSKPVRYRDHEHYVNLARYLQSSKTFHLRHDEPNLLEHHEHFVRGKYKGLEVTISGSELEYEREPAVVTNKPVTVYREDRLPVTSIPLTSREDVDRAGIDKIKDREPRYVRSRGFLVEHRKTGRVYRVGLQRRIGASTQARYYVIVEYIGRARGRPRFDEEPIIKDIAQLSRFLRRDPLLKPA